MVFLGLICAGIGCSFIGYAIGFTAASTKNRRSMDDPPEAMDGRYTLKELTGWMASLQTLLIQMELAQKREEMAIQKQQDNGDEASRYRIGPQPQ